MEKQYVSLKAVWITQNSTGNKNVSCYTPHHQDKYVAHLLYFTFVSF